MQSGAGATVGGCHTENKTKKEKRFCLNKKYMITFEMWSILICAVREYQTMSHLVNCQDIFLF